LSHPEAPPSNPTSESHQPDPFTGDWLFRPERSRLSTPAPRSWVQRISASSHELRVREELVSSDGSHTVVTVQAAFDGKQYPVSGSWFADTIAYTRPHPHSIEGTAQKEGSVSIRETLNVSPDGHTLTVKFTVLREGREAANGLAAFERLA
jgi:hypothetical protein